MAAAGLLTAISIAWAVPANAATHTQVKGEYGFGQIRSGNNPKWCMTWEKGAPNHSPVIMRPCVKGDLEQTWFLERVVVLGQIDLIYIPDVFLGQHGSSNVAVLVNQIESPKDADTIAFYEIPNTTRFVMEIIGWPGHKNFVATSVAVMKHGSYSVRWQKINSTIKAVKLTQSWDLPPWKPVK